MIDEPHPRDFGGRPVEMVNGWRWVIEGPHNREQYWRQRYFWSQRNKPHESETSDGYKDAFYQIAEVLDMAAMPISPKEAFETVMLPLLRELVAGRPSLKADAGQVMRDVARRAATLIPAHSEGGEGPTLEINLKASEASTDGNCRTGDYPCRFATETTERMTKGRCIYCGLPENGGTSP